MVLVAILGDGNAADQLHHEVRSPAIGGAGIEDPGDVRVIHQGQGLELGFESREDLSRVHAGPDDL